MAAISTNAIAAPAAQAVAAKSGANDASKAPDGTPFAAVLATTNAQQSAQAPSPSSHTGSAGKNEDGDTPSTAPDNNAKSDPATDANTQVAATVLADASSAQAVAAAQVGAQPQGAADPTVDAGAAPAKPGKNSKPANGNDPAGAGTQAQPLPAPAQPDPSLMAQMQPAIVSVPAQAAANDDSSDEGERGAVGATAKPGARTAPQAPSATGVSGAADPAATQAAINGHDNGHDNGASKDASANSPDNSDKAPAKTADNNNVPQTQSAPQTQNAPQTPQPAAPAPAAPAPAATIAAAAAATNSAGAATPTQTSGGHNLAATVQVQPATAPNISGLAVEIAARSQSGAKQFEIRLDPPELGRVDVRLSIDASGNAQAHLTADQPETLNLLQKDSSTLTQALRDSGLDVSQNGLNFSLRGQNSQTGADSGGREPAPRSNLAVTRVLDTAQSASNISFTGGGDQTRLDIHV